MKFKDNLRRQRNLTHLSQESLADQMSVSRQTISKWENGDTYPSTEHIFMLTKILNCDICDLINTLDKNDVANNKCECELETNSFKNQFYKKYLYWPVGMIVALFLMLLGFGIYRHFTEPSIDNSRLAVFDRLLDGSFDSVMETFSQDGYVDHQIVGYGITEGDGTFYIKCSLSDSSNNHCSAIIYFCNNDGDYFFKCQYLDDHDFVPKGNYHELGVI